MLKSCSFQTLDEYIVQIPMSDRFSIYHRLKELKIKSTCLPDGSLRVQVNDSLTAMLVRSTVWQFVANRQELIDWLERCWQF